MSKNKIFTSTNSMAEAKKRAKDAGYAIKGSTTVAFGNSCGYVVYGQPRKRK